MSDIPANTPVIVGLGFHQVKSDNPEDCPEALKMMLTAVRNAADDCGKPDICESFDSISVMRGSWQYLNPGILMAEELGCPNAKQVMSEIGVLQMMPIFQMCDAIAKGEQNIGVVTGGEVRYRDLRSLITGVPVEDTQQAEDTPEPDTYFKTPDAFSSELEAERGLWAPADFYAIADSALRYANGQTIMQRREEIASMYSGFSKVAADNPHSWSKDIISTEDFLSSENKNPMVTFPFSKKMISQWNINQSVALIMCSYAKAKELGLDEKQFIYPMAYVQSRHVVNLAQKENLHTHPGQVLSGERIYELADISSDDVDVADLYSCFPTSISTGAKDFDIEGKCPVSLTGSMALAGGPYNHAALDSIARVAEVLREQKLNEKDGGERKIGLSTNLSGMFGKMAVSLISTHAPGTGFHFDDMTDTVAAKEKSIPIDADFTGDATIIAYAVMYDKANITHAVAYCDTPEGKRTVVLTKNTELAEQMTQEEFVGKKITVQADGDFELAAA